MTYQVADRCKGTEKSNAQSLIIHKLYMAKIIRKLQDYFTKIPNKGIFVKKQEGKEHKKRANLSECPHYRRGATAIYLILAEAVCHRFCFLVSGKPSQPSDLPNCPFKPFSGTPSLQRGSDQWCKGNQLFWSHQTFIIFFEQSIINISHTTEDFHKNRHS